MNKTHEYEATIKKFSRAIAFSIFTCFLIFCFQLVLSSYANDLISLLSISTVAEAYIFEIILYLFYIGLPFLVAFFILKKKFKECDKISRPYPKRPLLYIFGTIGICYIINFILNLIVNALDLLPASSNIIVANTPIEIILCYAMYAVIPAFLEEWGFRGIILKMLLPFGKHGAIIISAILFGIAHQNPVNAIFATVFGTLLGICYEYTRSLKLPILIHFLNNAISVTISLLSETDKYVLQIGIFMIAMMTVGILALVYYCKNGLSHHIISIRKPYCIGYVLSAPKMLFKFVFNCMFIPYIIAYIYILSFIIK